MSRSTEYSSFQSAKTRCNNKKHPSYAGHGAKGREFRLQSVEQVIMNIGLKPDPYYSLERIDNNGHYEIGNIKWASPKEQANNRRPRRTPEQIAAEEQAEVERVLREEQERLNRTGLTKKFVEA